jgi:hypothetical protein
MKTTLVVLTTLIAACGGSPADVSSPPEQRHAAVGTAPAAAPAPVAVAEPAPVVVTPPTVAPPPPAVTYTVSGGVVTFSGSFTTSGYVFPGAVLFTTGADARPNGQRTGQLLLRTGPYSAGNQDQTADFVPIATDVTIDTDGTVHLAGTGTVLGGWVVDFGGLQYSL